MAPIKLKRIGDHREKSGTRLLLNLSINIFALLVVAYIVPGFILAGLRAAIVAAVVMGVVNTFIKPVVQILAIPFTLITLGLAAFFINVGFLWLVAKIVPGFDIDSFMTAIVASIILTLTSWFLHKLAK